MAGKEGEEQVGWPPLAGLAGDAWGEGLVMGMGGGGAEDGVSSRAACLCVGRADVSRGCVGGWGGGRYDLGMT